MKKLTLGQMQATLNAIYQVPPHPLLAAAAEKLKEGIEQKQNSINRKLAARRTSTRSTVQGEER